MTERSVPFALPVADEDARERFRGEWTRNFAVSANAGSGKTTAISERLAAMAMDPVAAPQLRRTAVVTYTLKAAEEIGERARERLLRRLAARGDGADLAPLEHLEGAFFGTLHSFCLKLAREHGHEAGLDLAPVLLDDSAAEAAWEEFLAGDPLTLDSVGGEALRELCRLVPMEDILNRAQELEPEQAAALRAAAPRGLPPRADGSGLARIEALPEKGSGAKNIRKTKLLARSWAEKAERTAAREFLGIFKPVGRSQVAVAAASAWMAPLSAWAAASAGAVAGEVAERFATWRRAAGLQTFADQVSAARALLRHPRTLAAVRAEGWRIILDEAQDTDEAQFAILVELARPAGAEPGGWPGRGEPPRSGHFCLVGDGQQSIYSSRASVRTFLRYLEAFDGGPAGERLNFGVTFRAPRVAVELLNRSLPWAFAAEREHSRGLPVADGAEGPLLQVAYQDLVAGPANEEGVVARVPISSAGGTGRTERKATYREEMKQIAAWLKARGPAGLGLKAWGELCVLVARNQWIDDAVRELEAAGLKVSRQSKQQRVGDQAAYAWLAGLAAVCVEPEDAYEWFGVLREIFGVSDALLAREKLRRGRFEWESPEVHPEPLRGALEALRPCVQAVDDEGVQLDGWCERLIAAGGLEAKARAVDANGATLRELERLRAEARAGASSGLAPREWTEALLRGRSAGRAENRSEADAITVQTCHSAKGLEWSAVLVPGLWREISFDAGAGLQVLRDERGDPLVYLRADDVPAETKESRERERRRELVRLLYVTLTRPRRMLLLPWDAEMAAVPERSFARLWGFDPAGLPELAWRPAEPATESRDLVVDQTSAPAAVSEAQLSPVGFGELAAGGVEAVAAGFVRRVLPHQLADGEADASRSVRQEADEETPLAPRPAEDPITYGLWWHETLEFFPWLGAEAAVEDYVAGRLKAAEQGGLGTRARAEWALFAGGAVWRELRAARWSRLTELAVFAPLGEAGWMDGVMDLVLHDAAAGEAWVLDWKTNRRRLGETEEAFLDRLVAEYAPQLRAYGGSLAAMFPTCRIRCLIYTTMLGRSIEVAQAVSGR